MKIFKSSLLHNFLLVILFLKMFTASSERLQKKSLSATDFLPSSSILYPLDFQKNWQASEPIPLNIHYTVPAYGQKDLFMALDIHSDLEHAANEKEEVRRRVVNELKRKEQMLWEKLQALKAKERNLKEQKSFRSSGSTD